MMLEFQERRALAEDLRSRKGAIARRAMDEFMEKHPGWLDNFGDAGRARSEEDYAFHVEFLASSLLTDDPGAFEDYARWTTGVLESRGVSADVLMESLEQVRAASREGAPQRLREIIDQITQRGVEAVRSMAEKGAGWDRREGRDLTSDANLYLQAIRTGERKAALTVALEALRKGATVPDVYGEILQPAQYEIGSLWERNEITVADEHLATAITQYVVAQLYAYLDIPIPKRGNALVTGVNGELHQLGANMVADVLEGDGWNVRFLGTELPHKDVLKAIDHHEARLLGISATILFNLPSVGDLIEDARSQFGSDLRIVVGGGAFRSKPDIWRELGADGFGMDLTEAVTVSKQVTEAA